MYYTISEYRKLITYNQQWEREEKSQKGQKTMSILMI